MILIFLSSGLFLGWSLGANDAANVFGTAVGTKMVRFRTAAIIASIFVILGAVIEGGGASHTLGKLGAVNAISGSFTVALAAAITVFSMTKLKLPVSTSQAIVGAIIGWNFFSGSLTDFSSLTKIVTTWVLCPILAAIFSFAFFFIFKFLLAKTKIHLLFLDFYTRIALVLVGAFGAYSLGANNIANVVGVFIADSPFHDISIYNILHLTGVQQLFLLGAIAISIGIFTYSYKVMNTVGNDLFKLSPVAAFIVVLSESIVLFLFASSGLRDWLISHNLPAIPLVPVSSSQAVVGGVIGIALAKGGRNLKIDVLGRISSGWVTTPLIAFVISFTSLFFVQNVFDQKTYIATEHVFTGEVMEKIYDEGLDFKTYNALKDETFKNSLDLNKKLKEFPTLTKEDKSMIFEISAHKKMFILLTQIHEIEDKKIVSKKRAEALYLIKGQYFDHTWELQNMLSSLSDEWKYKPNDKKYNSEIDKDLTKIVRLFRMKE